MIKKYLLSFVTTVSCVLGAVPGEAGAPELLKVKASKASYQIGEKAFIQVYTPVQPSNQAYEYFLTATLDQVSQKVVTVSVRESYILTNPLVDASSKVLKVSLFLQDKKFAKDTRVSIQSYKKRNAEIDERLLDETNEAIRTSLIAQKNRNLNFIAQAEQSLTAHRSLLAESSHSILMTESLVRTFQASPVIQVWRDRANGKYFTGEYPNFFVKVKSGMQLEDGPAEFVANGRDVDSSISFSRKRISDREFAFAGRKLTVDDFGLKNFEASVFFRSKAQADSIRSAIANIGKLQKQYVASRNQTTDVAEKEYYNLLIAELDEAKTNYNNQLNNMLMILGAVISGFEVGPASSDLFGVTVLAANTSIEEGAGSQVTVTLNGQPTHSVSVRLNPSEDLTVDGAAPGEPVELNFTTSNWNVPQVVNVIALDDHIDRGDSYTASVLLSVSSSDSRYNLYEISPLNIVVSDNDEGALLFDGDLNLQEGGSGNFRVKINSSPTAPVTVSFTTDGLTSVAQTLEFDSTNWNGYQEVSVQALEDLVDRGELYNSTITVSLTSADSIYNSLSYTKVAQIIDNDMAGFDVIESDDTTSVAEGGSNDTLQIRLNTQPTVPVTVFFETGVQIQPIESVVFDASNWNVYQTVQFVALDDLVVEGIHVGNISIGANGDAYTNIPHVQISVTITDNEDPEPQVTAISSGDSVLCFVVGGKVKCLGPNYSGQLGNGTNTDSATPVEALGIDGATSVTSGFISSCAVENGAVKCWGSNYAGQLGDGTRNDSNVPVAVVGLSSGVTEVSSYDKTCAVVNSSVKCWGQSIGDNPVNIAGTNGATSVNVSSSGSCAVVNSSVKCWSGSSVVAQTVPGLEAGATAIAMGRNFSCAVVNGGVVCWGVNSNGQLGNGSTVDSSTPVAVSGITSGATSVSASTYHACAAVNGGVKCWGGNQQHQLGDTTAIDRPSPVSAIPDNSNVVSVKVGESNSCAIRDGNAYCWGTWTRFSATPSKIEGL